MGEFQSGISEAFGTLHYLAGETWQIVDTGATFRVIQARDAGSFDVMIGSTDFKRDLRLTCLKSDFANDYPKARTVLFRQVAPNVKYWIDSDALVENNSQPTFTLSVKLKKG